MNTLTIDRDEIVEQAYFFRALRERLDFELPMQEVLANLRNEILSTTRLPLAIDFLLSELLAQGALSPAMRRLDHYFRPFQAFVMEEAERDQGKFDLQIGLEVLQRESEYRAEAPTPAGVFLYQFEAISRNRLRYDEGLAAMQGDPIYDEAWRSWLRYVTLQIGIIDIADLIYLASEEYCKDRRRRGVDVEEEAMSPLFAEKEGKIAAANRGREPLLLLLALQRHLGYPAVPRPRPTDDSIDQVPQLSRRIERLEARLKLMEEEQKGGIDITKFYEKPPKPTPE